MASKFSILIFLTFLIYPTFGVAEGERKVNCDSINEQYDDCMKNNAGSNAKQSSCYTMFNNAAVNCCKDAGRSQFSCDFMKKFLSHTKEGNLKIPSEKEVDDCNNIKKQYDDCMKNNTGSNAKQSACYRKGRETAASCCKLAGKNQFSCDFIKDFLKHTQD